LTLQILKGKLEKADIMLGGLIIEPKSKYSSAASEESSGKMSILTKTKYTFLKNSLEATVEELEKWQQRFDPSWFLITRIPGVSFSQSLGQREPRLNQDNSLTMVKEPMMSELQLNTAAKAQRSIFIPRDSVAAERTELPFSTALLSKNSATGETVLVDTMIPHPAASVQNTKAAVRDLGRVLSKVDPSTFCLLRCIGVIETTNKYQTATLPVEPTTPQEYNTTFQFIFACPAHAKNPRSLRCLLRDADPKYPLNERIDLARQLANSVMFLHISKFVHKDIRPETVLVYGDDKSQIGSLFLTGFSKIRPASGMTYYQGDTLWEQNFCKSLSRQRVYYIY
jgi:hypothetical protein